MHFPRGTVVVLAGLMLLVAGCARESNLVRNSFQAVGIGGEPKPAPDFVTSTRPSEDDLDYVPVGTSAPRRSNKAKDAASVSTSETELNAVKARNESLAAEARTAGATPPAAPQPPIPPLPPQ